MAKIKLQDQLGRVVTFDPEATQGATVGKDLRWPDGTTVQESQIRGVSSSSSTGSATATLWRLIRETPANLVKIAALATTGFTTRDADGNWLQRSIAEGSGISVVNGDGMAGSPTVSLADLPDTGAGAALRKITRDGKGRVAGTAAATTGDLPEGANQYFTNARADARVALQRSVPAKLTSGAASPIPLNANGTIPAKLADGTVSNIPVRA